MDPWQQIAHTESTGGINHARSRSQDHDSNSRSGCAALFGPDRDKSGPLADELRPARGVERLIADAFALYLKTKNFQWHVSGPHFRDYYLLFEEQATQILPMTDAIAERIRKNGARTLRSIGHIARMQRLRDNDHELVAPQQMLGELTVDNAALARSLEEAHELCEQQRDVATARLIEGWIDEAQNRVWFLRETNRASGE